MRPGAVPQDNELADDLNQDSSKKLPVQTVRPATDDITTSAPGATTSFHEQRAQGGVHTQTFPSSSSEAISGRIRFGTSSRSPSSAPVSAH